MRTVPAAVIALLLLCACSPGGDVTESFVPPPAPDDPRNARIAFHEDRVRADPGDAVALNALAEEYLERFRRTGVDDDLVRARDTAERSLVAVPAEVNARGLELRARATFSLHGFAAARDDAARLVGMVPAKRAPLEILGDCQFELGDYDGAAATYERLAAGDGRRDAATQVRLSKLAIVRGDTRKAKRFLDAAVRLAEERQPPSVELVVWCRVQAGQLAFSTGDWDTAREHYAAALAAAPDDWTAIDHIAELKAAERKYKEAASLYEKLVVRVARPELLQALGDVYVAAGRADDATRVHRRALALYRDASTKGLTHYDHHLVGYLTDVEPAPTEAVALAKKDLTTRQSIGAWEALAWAQSLAGDHAGSVQAMDKALATGAVDPHILYHASLIYGRAGDEGKAREFLRRAAEANPKFLEFHVHR